MGLYFNLSSEEKEYVKKKSFFCIIVYLGNREETLRLNTDEVEIEKEDCLFF